MLGACGRRLSGGYAAGTTCGPVAHRPVRFNAPGSRLHDSHSLRERGRQRRPVQARARLRGGPVAARFVLEQQVLKK